MNSLQRAKAILNEEGVTCAAVRGEMLYRSVLHGIAPIMTKMLENKAFFEGASVADKVIGKSAALLLIGSGIQELYADVISEYAVDVLEQENISFVFGKKVPYIINRAGTGICPMEESVLKVSDTEEAFLILKEKIHQMKK